jgi:hypothetical protein
MILRFLKPEGFTLVYSSFTQKIARRLQKIIKARDKLLVEIPPYRFEEIRRRLSKHIQNIADEEVAFDLTGGTKVMAFAAYDIAYSLQTNAYYLRSQQESVLSKYNFSGMGVTEERIEIPHGLFSLQDYLSVYLDNFQITGPCKALEGRDFEIAVKEAIKPMVDEIVAGVRSVGGQLDLDLAFRLGNLVGIAELKTGKKGDEKDALEQLKSAASREFLGTFTKPFLIIDHSWGPRQYNLRELALAWEITVIELPSYRKDGRISSKDLEKLCSTISKALNGG